MHGRRVSEERSRIRDNEWGDWLAACGALRLVGCRGFMFGLADGVVGLTRTMQKGAASLAPAGEEKSVACREPGSLGACERVGQKVDGEREQPITLYT
jgi:hypothetical protein